MYATGTTHNVGLGNLPSAVAKKVTDAKMKQMEETHQRQRQELAADLRRIEARMHSEAFSSDILKRLSSIREQLNKSPTKRRKKSVRFAPGVKRDSRHRVMH